MCAHGMEGHTSMEEADGIAQPTPLDGRLAWAQPGEFAIPPSAILQVSNLKDAFNYATVPAGLTACLPSRVAILRCFEGIPQGNDRAHP